MKDLESKAIERIKTASAMSLHHYGKPLVCTYSGGKDSDVLLELFRRSGIPFEAHHNHTTVDAPATVYHIRKVFAGLEEKGIACTVKMPNISMWQLIPLKLMPPTRAVRYCCSELKENGTPNRCIALGIRWAESNRRAGRAEYEVISPQKKGRIGVSDEMMFLSDNEDRRRLIEKCDLKALTAVNPIIDWSDSDIWTFIRAEKVPYNSLYDCGYLRVGCVGCPMAGKGRYKEFSDFPEYERAYRRAFEKMLEVRKAKGKKSDKWKTADDVFRWWMEDKNIEGQMSIFEFVEERDDKH